MAGKRRRKKQSKAVSLLLSVLILAVMFVGGIMLLDGFRPTPIYNQLNVNVQHKRFINKILPEAVKMQDKYKILTSISLAQAILESNWGTSKLANKYKNLYGIKASPEQPGVQLETTEFTSGKPITIKGRFRTYNSWDESVRAHAILLARGTDWNPEQYKEVVDADNFESAARGLNIDGYATDPAYTKKIIHIIKKYHLNKYDKQK